MLDSCAPCGDLGGLRPSRSRTAVAVLSASLLGPTACSSPGPAPAAFEAEDRALDDVHYVDIARRAGLRIVTACGDPDKKHLLESTGTGVAVADYDRDGDLDLYFTTAQTTTDWLAGRKPRANALYRNDGDGAFTDVAREAGVARADWNAGAYFADYDNDGDADLFLTAWGPNALYRNDGDGTFTDVTRQAGVAGPPDAWSASAAFGDLDRDGDLDLYVANYVQYDLRDPELGGLKTLWHGIPVYRGPVGLVGQSDVLYRNNGDGTFTDVTREAGIADLHPPHYGLGVVMSDLDDDADLDIYVANDSQPNFLWRNDGGLRFTEIAALAGVATNEDAKEQAGMGVDAGDFDGDLRQDLFVTNFSHDWNTLYRNRGDMVFSDDTFPAGLRDSYRYLAWGTKFFDYDNDGWLDLFVANGHIYTDVDRHPQLGTSYRQENFLYRNLGGRGFENRTPSAGPGLRLVDSSRGVAVADVDRDGDLDLVVTHIDSTPNLLINEGGNRRAWIALKLEGTRSNRDAVGARVVLEAGGRKQLREVNPYGSYLSQGDPALHFGLGDAEVVDRVTIRWPSGLTEVLERLPARSFLTVVEGRGAAVTTAPRPAGAQR